MKRLMVGILTSVTCLILVSFLSTSTHAVESGAPKNKGLYITPVRQFVSQDAGSVKDSSVTIGNYTDEPMDIGFDIQSFEVADFDYDVGFSDPRDKFISFDTKNIRLKPNESRRIAYRVNIPAGTAPGGKYYTLLATGRGQNGTAEQQIQAASQLYLTINGALVRNSNLPASSINHFVFRPNIPFTLDITNSGNVHYYAFVTAKVSGLLAGTAGSTETHLLLPGKTRRIQSTVKSPILPGIYRVTYGYRTDTQPAVIRVSRIVYFPPWSLAALVLIIWITSILHQRRSRRRQPSQTGGTDFPKQSDTTDL